MAASTEGQKRNEMDVSKLTALQKRLSDEMQRHAASVEEIQREMQEATRELTQSLMNSTQASDKGQAEATFTEKSLSAEQLQTLLDALQKRSEQSNPFGKKVTSEQAQTLLKKDPSLAWSLFNGMQWGAQWELDKKDGLPANAYDLSPELDIPEQLARLRAIPAEIRDATIQELRKQYPNIPADAFDRSDDDQRGPNKWEEQLLNIVSGTESMSEEEYRAAQKKLPQAERLDLRGISWLQATPEQLTRGVAPNGLRYGGDVFVYGNFAGYRDVVRGGRARAKGSVA
ncbi:MAG: hypothetical protein PHZ00_06260 [Candidatus Peribacteraceae bacterium]|nr:hypothetical protein [Candidatus Peribacteraceae bacterium]